MDNFSRKIKWRFWWVKFYYLLKILFCQPWKLHNSEINPAFGVRASNVRMYFDKYDAGLNIIGIENTGMSLVSNFK